MSSSRLPRLLAAEIAAAAVPAACPMPMQVTVTRLEASAADSAE